MDGWIVFFTCDLDNNTNNRIGRINRIRIKPKWKKPIIKMLTQKQTKNGRIICFSQCLFVFCFSLVVNLVTFVITKNDKNLIGWKFLFDDDDDFDVVNDDDDVCVMWIFFHSVLDSHFINQQSNTNMNKTQELKKTKLREFFFWFFVIVRMMNVEQQDQQEKMMISNDDNGTKKKKFNSINFVINVFHFIFWCDIFLFTYFRFWKMTNIICLLLVW